MCLRRMCLLVLLDGIRSIYSILLFMSTVSLLIFCLKDLSIVESGILKSPTRTVLLSMSPFSLLILVLYI